MILLPVGNYTSTVAKSMILITNVIILVSSPVPKDCLATIKNKQDKSYCVWQAHCPDMDVPAIQPTYNIIFQENTLNGKKPTLIWQK